MQLVRRVRTATVPQVCGGGRRPPRRRKCILIRNTTWDQFFAILFINITCSPEVLTRTLRATMTSAVSRAADSELAVRELTFNLFKSPINIPTTELAILYFRL